MSTPIEDTFQFVLSDRIQLNTGIPLCVGVYLQIPVTSCTPESDRKVNESVRGSEREKWEQVMGWALTSGIKAFHYGFPVKLETEEGPGGQRTATIPIAPWRLVGLSQGLLVIGAAQVIRCF